MNRRTETLTRVPLAEEGVLLCDEDRASLIDELTQALLVDVPVLGHLLASELVTAEQVRDNRLWLIFQLAEATSTSFDLFPEPVRPSFLQEVRKAREQLEAVEWRIREAAGEGRAPGDGVPDNAEESSTRAIRQLVRRRAKAGQLTIPGLLMPRQIDIGQVPKTMNRGPRLRISALVASMTRTRAKLENVAIEASDMPRARAIPEVFSCNVLERDLGSEHFVFGEVLRHAMDTRKRVDVEVLVVLDWATGMAVAFRQIS